jgi:hypothetical protein
MSFEHERAHFRIQYPTAARPRLVVGEAVHEVIDLSEGGIRFRPSTPLELERDDEVQGVLRFARGEETHLLGRVLRSDGRDVVLRIEAGVDFRTVLDEQRWLLQQNYGLTW